MTALYLDQPALDTLATAPESLLLAPAVPDVIALDNPDYRTHPLGLTWLMTATPAGDIEPVPALASLRIADYYAGVAAGRRDALGGAA